MHYTQMPIKLLFTANDNAEWRGIFSFLHQKRNTFQFKTLNLIEIYLKQKFSKGKDFDVLEVF